jgi:hypothetical protein
MASSSRPSRPASTGRIWIRSGCRVRVLGAGICRMAYSMASAASRPGMIESRIALRTPTITTRPNARSGPPTAPSAEQFSKIGSWNAQTASDTNYSDWEAALGRQPIGETTRDSQLFGGVWDSGCRRTVTSGGYRHVINPPVLNLLGRSHARPYVFSTSGSTGNVSRRIDPKTRVNCHRIALSSRGSNADATCAPIDDIPRASNTRGLTTPPPPQASTPMRRRSRAPPGVPRGGQAQSGQCLRDAGRPARFARQGHVQDGRGGVG